MHYTVLLESFHAFFMLFLSLLKDPPSHCINRNVPEIHLISWMAEYSFQITLGEPDKTARLNCIT